MKLFIVVSNFKKYEKNTTSIIKQLLKFFDISLSKDDSMTLFKNVSYHLFDIKDADYVVSIGGDGTFLKACRLSLIPQKRVIGIRVGRRGYLCSFDSKEIITKAKIEKLTFKKEITLKTKYGVAINDVIVGKDNFGKTTSLKVSVDNKDLCEFRSDGVIVASKLGSNAYSKACGAPVIVTKNRFIITAICPCYGEFKYKQVLDKMKITISLLSKHYPASIYCDGEKIASLNNSVTINKADKQLRIIQ